MTDATDWADEMRLLARHDPAVEVVTVVGLDGDLEDGVTKSAADIVVVKTGAIEEKLASDMEILNRERTFPIVVVSDDLGSETMERAAEAGVSVLTPSSRGLTDMSAVLKWSQAQSSAVGELRRKLHKVETKLAERAVVERAKGVIMKSRGIDEGEAYRMMRGLAMQRGLPLARVARAVIDSAELLN